MTPQEAINQLKLNNKWDYVVDDDLKAFKVAITALEKQIPKVVDEYKVFEDGTLYNIDFMCPACGWAVIGQPYEPNFCKHCGQALDWSGTE